MKKPTKGVMPEHLKKHAWPKGVSGNVSGRKPKGSISESYARALREVDPETGLTYAEGIASQVLQMAISGNATA